MSYLPQDPNQTTDQQNNSNIPTLAPAGGPSQSSNGQTGPNQSPGSQPSAPWQNITTYLSANAPQAQQTANQVSGNLTQGYNDIKGGIDTTAQNFTNQVNQGTVKENTAQVNQAKASPQKFVQNPNNVQDFQKMWNASYTGPQNFSSSPDYTNLQGKVQAGQQKANLVNQGEAGYQTLLKGVESNPTAGVNALDTLLIQGNPTYAKQIQSAANPYAALTDYLNTQQAALDAAASAGQATTQATQQDIQNQFVGSGGVIPTFDQGLESKASNAANQFSSSNQAINDLNSGKLSQADANAFGMSPDDFTWYMNGLQGTSPSNQAGWFPGTASAVSSANPQIESVASPEDFAEQSALEQLIGTYQGPLNQQLSNLAGTYQAPKLGQFTRPTVHQDFSNLIRPLQGGNISPQNILYPNSIPGNV